MSLKDIPVQLKIDSEEDLRTMVLSYCSELGFDPDEISCEDHFSITLGHTTVTTDKKTAGGRSDILISRNSKPLAIIETKSPAHELTDNDARQAISYARLLATIAPFAIVTNGMETRVYDVLASELTRVDNPQESIWNKKGQQTTGIEDELRYEATKLLIAVNPDTLSRFCKQQVATGLIDLKSDVKKNKKYNPELYVERHSLNKAFTDWLQGNLSVFAVIAPSGYGKTNFMCAKTEEITSSHFALFYSAGRFTSGLINSVKNDFIWEFHRDRETVQIFDRLDTITKNTGKKLLIFVDAIDETPSGIIDIRNELLDIVAKIQQYPNIRLVLSCKSFDWPYIVTDGNQSFNFLAETIDPSRSHPETRLIIPDANNVGIHLAEFTNEELNEAITKYKSAYSIDGDFHGEILEESHNPLMLRFVSEIYGGGREKLPTSISSLELFILYLQRKLEPIENPNIGEIILSKVASLIFASGIRNVSKDEIISGLAWNESYDKALQSLFRLGILSKTNINEQEMVGFEFNKFLLYFYVFKVKKLQTLSPSNQIPLIHELLKTSVGIEALDFYLVAVGQSIAQKILIELAGQDFSTLSQIITGLSGIDKYKKLPVPFDNILYYLEFYNFLRDNFFGELANSTMPYTKMPLGVISIVNSPEMFRACTPAYPQPYVTVDDKDLIRQLLKGPMSRQLAQDLMPVGTYYLGGIHGLAEYPQKASYLHLIREVSSALSNRLLNESVSRDILQERIYAVLLYEPSAWMVGDDLPYEHYWKILGYENVEALGETKVSELIDRIKNLLQSFNEKLRKLNRGDTLFPSYYHRSRELFATLFTLGQLDADQSLGMVRCSPDKLLRRSSDSVETVEKEMEKLIPIIIENYKLIFLKNFPSLINYSPFFKNIDKLAIVEILRLKSFSEFPALSYIVFPNADKPISTKIVNTPFNRSIIGNLKFRTLHSEWHSQGVESGCGYSEIDITLDDIRLYDPKAWIIKTRFSYLTPILNQVYSLISEDLKRILQAERRDWKDDMSSNLTNDAYLRMVTNSLIRSK